MQIEIEPKSREVRLRGKGKRSLLIHFYERDGVEIISFELCDNGIRRGGRLPDIEFTDRDTLLRHIGNRLEQIK